MRREKICRAVLSGLCVLLAALLAAGAVSIYLGGSARRAENPRESIYTAESAAAWLVPAAPLFLAVLAIAAVCTALGIRPSEKPVRQLCPVKHRAEPDYIRFVRAALLIAAAVLTAAGILNGSARDVLVKAITICTECVGLG